jgi:alpha-tubulin suppressor-like RCC1 family protein
MRRRTFTLSLTCLSSAMFTVNADADGSSEVLASYYSRHMALVDGVAHAWIGTGSPQKMLEGVKEVGVSQDAFFGLLQGGDLLRWADMPGRATMLRQGVTSFAVGQSGCFAIDRRQTLWRAVGDHFAFTRVSDDVAAACIGDGADYYVVRDGTLFVKGLAHRGQYGDGLLTATPDFIATARDAVAVRAHTGHALFLRRDGVVLGTGGNRYGPLSSHGLGDKADRWGPVFDGAKAIATGSRHSAALRADATLWAWGDGFDIKPRKLLDQVTAVACGDTATLARTTDGNVWQWDRGAGPRRLALR